MSARSVVLITGARAPAALDLARSFAAAGYAPHLADCAPCWAARWSRATAGFHRYAAPTAHPEAFERDLRTLVERLGPRLVVPACEEVFHLAALARRWPDLKTLLLAPDFETARHLRSRALFAQTCGVHGLPTPQTWVLQGVDDLNALPSARTLVFRPEYPRHDTPALVRPEPARLAELRPTPQARWVAQRHMTGTKASFYAACRDGRLTAFAAYRATWREPDGAAYGFEALPERATADLLAIAAALAAVVRHGQFACDLIIDAEGRPWLLGCQPRAGGGAHLFDRDPALAHALSGDGQPVQAARTTLRYLGPTYRRFGPSMARAEGRLDAWRQGQSEGRDVIGAPGDRGPLLGARVDRLVFSARARAAGRTLASAMTADIEWTGDRA